jgi:hypothetical protein
VADKFCDRCPIKAHLFESDGTSTVELQRLRRENALLKRRLEIVIRAAKKFRAAVANSETATVLH